VGRGAADGLNGRNARARVTTRIDGALGARRAPAALFAAGAFCVVELDDADIPELQRFFAANPDYFLAVNGQPAADDEAYEELHGALPSGWPHTKKWILGFVDASGALAGMANVVSDLLATGIWHIGLFMVATGLHGSGAARSLHQQLERWVRGQGAQWLRLGVVEGNARAERFWTRCGYVEVRKRHGMAMGRRVNTVRVMVKPLAGRSLPDYLALVERDRPEPGEAEDSG